MTSHPKRSKRLSQQAQSKLYKAEWMTWREIATMDIYRRKIHQLWKENPELYDYRIVMGMIDRRPIVV